MIAAGAGTGSGAGGVGQATTPPSGATPGGLIHLFARHPVAANLLMLIMLLMGLFALGKLNRQFFPNFALDYISVRIVWPGASTEDVERSITVPVEQALRSLDDVKEMTSTSTRGVSAILIEYQQGADMGVALDQVKQYVSAIRHLPSDAEAPVVTRIARHEPVASLILTGDVSLDELRPLAYRFERELLDRGIARITFSGMPKEEIAIEASSNRLQQLGLSLNQLGARILHQSRDIPAGAVGENEAAREIRGEQQGRSVQAFRQLELAPPATAAATAAATDSGKAAGEMPLRLDEIADVHQRIKENQAEIFYHDQPAIVLNLQRAETTDALKAAQIMQQWLAETRPALPAGVQIKVFDERYSLIQQRIDLLLKNGVSGLLLVIIILYLFLNGRVAFWVAVGIPTSFMGALAVLYFSGGSINMVSLFALIMALGIIVDDAIVVAEDALTHYQSGERSLTAAEGGALRMLAPVVSSSLTTIAAFLPLMMVSGIIGSILFDIQLIIICVILASLIECFLILPGHLRHSFHRNHHRKPGALRQSLDARFNRFRDHFFRPLLQAALRNRLATISLAIAALVLSLSLVIFSQVKFEFFPQPESTVVIASVKFSAGTPPQQIKAFARRMEHALFATDRALRDDRPLVRTALLRLNTATFDGGRNYQKGSQYAMVQVELLEPDARTVRNTAFIDAWRKRLPQVAGIEQLSINSPRGGPPGRDIDIFLTGADAHTLKQAATELAEKMAAYQGLSSIIDDLPYGRQQYVFTLKPAARAAGLSMEEVGAQLRAAIDGLLLQVFYEQDDEVEVRIMLPENERKYQSILQTLPLITPSGDYLLLPDAVTLQTFQGLELLRHTDRKLGVHVTAEVDSRRTNAREVLQSLQRTVIPEVLQKYGLQVSYKGRAEEERETSGDMKYGSLLALVMIYIILAWVFASWLWPLAVMLIVPFGISGAIFGHWFTGIDLTILSQFGMFGLLGIVINDSIILVSFYRHLRDKGMDAENALVEASCQRLRAVLLTSLTTIAGLTPLLFETSLQAQFLIPMATSICFGLAFTTLLVLFLVPVFLSFVEGGRGAGKRALV